MRQQGHQAAVAPFLAGGLIVQAEMRAHGAVHIGHQFRGQIHRRLFRLHLRRMRETELVLLSERTLRIVRPDGRGRRDEIVLSPAWLRVRLLESPNAVPRLVLRARGRHWEVARLLGEVEKRDLAAALSAALHRWNHPVFANPQLDIDDPIDAP